MRQPDAQNQSAAGGGLRGKRLLGQHHGMLREGGHNRGAHLYAAGVLAGQRQKGQRVCPRDLRHPVSVEAVSLRGDGLLDLALHRGFGAPGTHE